MCGSMKRMSEKRRNIVKFTYFLAIGVIVVLPLYFVYANDECVPNPGVDLTGSIDLIAGTGTVTNHSTNCFYNIGLASYQEYDNNVENQALFSSDLRIIDPNSTLDLTVSLPSCSYQLDLFHDSLITSFADGTRYGARLVASGEINGWSPEKTLDYCGVTPPPPPVLGCTDPNATNYNPDATQDDGSCQYPPVNTKATLVVTKIICNEESYLPNWGAGSPDINQNSASNWLLEGDNNEHCDLVPWQFEWAKSGTENPGDNTGIAGGLWNKFSTSTSISLDDLGGDLIWVREVWNVDYIQFSGLNTNHHISAEFYCHTDVLHYDNYDFISPVEAGKTYYCLAFNVLTEDEPEPPLQVTVNLVANPDSITDGATSTLSWASTNANICDAVWTLATSTSGSQMVSPTTTTAYSITCGNGQATSTASKTVTVTTGGGDGSNPPPQPSVTLIADGGDGGGGSGSSRPPSGGVVLGISTTECFYLRDYLKRDFNNDSLEVLKLQAFLKNFEGHNNLSFTGVFDQATYDAVSIFQMKYFKDVLEPWGYTNPTGYVYILTKKKINEIYCQRPFPLNQDQINEINAFRSFLEKSLNQDGIGTTSSPQPGQVGGISISTIPVELVPDEPDGYKGQNINCSSCLTSLIFAWPESLSDTLKCIYLLLLILIVLYILGSVLRDVFYKDIPENNHKRFMVKWFSLNLGIIVSIAVAYIWGWFCLILPLLVALVVSLIWSISYPEHNSLRASVKSWYLVIVARAKSIMRGAKNVENIESKENTVIILPKASVPPTPKWPLTNSTSAEPKIHIISSKKPAKDSQMPPTEPLV
jgi:hypothetical protein